MTAIFNLPAGHSCPFANLCRSSADRITGRITDGPNTVFRCYAAMLETRPKVRKNNWNNFEQVKGKTLSQLISLISNCLPEALRYRIHSSGDFFNQTYFDAWLQVARTHPHTIFYAYTKAIPFWIARLNDIPANFRLVASYGGLYDNLIAKHGLRYAKVVASEREAKKLNLRCDKDDSLAYGTNESFALLIHGVQPAGSAMGQAWQKIKAAKHPGKVKVKKQSKILLNK